MIQVSNLSKSYGKQVLFDDATFAINSGERIGLIGRNGHGKTTLFRLFCGEEFADSGKIHYPDGYRVGYLSQHLVFNQPTVLEEASLGLPEQEGGWREIHRVEAVLHGLGFPSTSFSSSPLALSGGFQVRLNLAKLLVSEPNLLLLDEPTNYLDILSLRWLAEFLKSWSGELMIITHDHGFLNQVTTHTIGIHRSKVRKISGDTHKYYAQLEMEEEVHEQSRRNQEKKIQEAELFIRTFRAKASKAKAVQSRIKALERMDSLDKLEEIDELDFRFSHQPFPGKRLLDLANISFRYSDDNHFLIQDLSLTVGANDRIGVIGKNGKGKSTLLRLFVGELPPTIGSVTPSPNLKVAYFGQTNVDRLHKNNTIEDELLSAMAIPNRTRARSVAGLMMFEGDDALKSIKILSGGEKSRTLLGKLLLTPANLLILDEPTNHLDLYSADALLQAVIDFPGAAIIVTHSEEFLRQTATKLLVFDRGSVALFDGSYDDFLERVGWSEETPPSAKQATSKNAINRKEIRKQRADLLKRRTLELDPLQAEVSRLEARITQMETTIATHTAELIDKTKEGFGKQGEELARKIHKEKEEIDSLYTKLEATLARLETRQLDFEKELQELGR